MRILGISSSPEYDGHTARLVRRALEAAEAAGAEVREIHLPGLRIEHCRGCMACMAAGACAIEDDFAELREEMLSADGLVLGSPTYAMTFNARMKILLERLGMFAVYTSLFADKYVVGISTAGGMGAKKTARDLTGIVGGFFGSGKRSGLLAVHRGWNDLDARSLAAAAALGRRLVTDIHVRRPYRLQGLSGRILAGVVAAVVIRRNIMDHRSDRMRAVYESLVSRGRLRPPREERNRN